jgi:hypothetical protein
MDPHSFPHSGSTYQSPDSATAKNKIETGVGAVRVR